VRTPARVPRLVQHHARTGGGFDTVPCKSKCLVAVCMAMPVRPLEHISCCVFVCVATACLVLWAGELGFRDILDTVHRAVRELGMRNIWLLSVLLKSYSLTVPAPLPAWLYNVVINEPRCEEGCCVFYHGLLTISLREHSQCVIVTQFSPYTSFWFLIRFDFASGSLVTRQTGRG
jgi:hypothetical protein